MCVFFHPGVEGALASAAGADGEGAHFGRRYSGVHPAGGAAASIQYLIEHAAYVETDLIVIGNLEVGDDYVQSLEAARVAAAVGLRADLYAPMV